MPDALKPTPTDDDPVEVERAWAEEIRRRVEALRAGEGETIDGDEAMARLRARLDPHRG